MAFGLLGLLRSLFFSLLLGLIFISPDALQAQEAANPATSLPDPLTPPAIQALVARLSDQEVREVLLRELDARAVSTPGSEVQPAPLVETIASPVRSIIAKLVVAVTASPQNTMAATAAIGQYFASLGPGGVLRLVLAMAAAILVGIAVDALYSRRMAGRVAAQEAFHSDAPAFPASIPFLARRLLRDAGGAILAVTAAAVILVLVLPDRETRIAMTVALYLFFAPRLALIVLRFFLSPKHPALRLVDTDDQTAGILVRNLVGILIAVGAIKTLRLVVYEIGSDEAAQNIGFWVNLMVFVWLAVTVIRCRSGLKQIVNGRQDHLASGNEPYVFPYPAFALTAIGLIWIAGTVAEVSGNADVVGEGRHFISLALLLVAPLCDRLIRATVRIFVPPMRGSGPAALDAYQSAWRSYVRVARVIVFGTIVVILADLWDVSVLGVAQAGVGKRLGENVVGALLIGLVGYIVLEIVSLPFNRKLASERSDSATGDPQEMDDGPTGGAASRLGTILPLISWALQSAIIVITLLTALSHMGVDVTALLAGAGVLGIALGFGAQKLVADVVSGLFFLIDDAFRLNEYINVGSIEGTVEKIALRSILLRQSDGPINCVPYSSINSVTNFGRDWGTMKQVFTVPFDTDIERVRKIFKRIGQDLSENPEFRDAFLQPFKYKGVSQVNDVGIVLRGKFMFKPELSKQFLIQREIYRRVQADFAAAGIQFARREVRVSVDTQGEPLTEEATKTIASAAAATGAAPQPKPAA